MAADPTPSRSPLPAAAREGLMRAWLEILHERHPGVTWIPAERDGQGRAPATRVAPLEQKPPADGTRTP